MAWANEGPHGATSVSISVGLLLFVFIVIFVRSGRLKVSHVIVCGLLGFYLAGTTVAPTIRSGLDSTAQMVSTLDP
ncbi:hypothetical protein G5C51_13035 [Streptomyces sp. A7024]|uniref:Uncharacterized protein n=1 Tax=Streptomyces coryli TaxID=1128680 RepID=A0A6G4TZD5_9ACTN|nr:hypothetical protein [Streptomyces coryli]NGN64816.1 hypothetical protein [Streptomyces coryli]